jgi:hypothetical protein
MGCPHWLVPGRWEVHSERLGTGIDRLPPHPPRLGFQLRKVERCLRNFVAFLQVEGASYITTELTLRWTIQFAKVQHSTRAEHLGMVRRFASWRSATEPRTEIPPAELLPHRYRRKPPHIYSDEEIERLLRQAQQLPSPKGLRARTITTLFGLLAVTWMRVSEPWVGPTGCRPQSRHPSHPAGKVGEIALPAGDYLGHA